MSTLNVPIDTIRRFKDAKSDLEMLACAIIIKRRFQNSCLYSLQITKVMDLFGVSHRKAQKLIERLKTHELFIYNPDKDCLFAKTLKSKSKKCYGRKGKVYAAKSDYCRKLQVSDDVTLRKMVKQLRDSLLLNVVRAVAHDGFKHGKVCPPRGAQNSDKTKLATKQNFGDVIKMRNFAKSLGMSKSSASRYIKRLVEERQIAKSNLLADCVINHLNEETLYDYHKRNKRPIVPFCDKYGHWSGWVIFGFAYSISDRTAEDSFKNVIYNFKRSNSNVATCVCSELDGERYWANHYALNQ